MEYSGWNNLIAARFFNPEMADRRVHLNATRELINDLGKADGVGYADFIEESRAVLKTFTVAGSAKRPSNCFALGGVSIYLSHLIWLT